MKSLHREIADYSVPVAFAIDDPLNDFIWQNNDFSSFSVSNIDYNNDNLDSETNVVFTIDKDKSGTTTMATTVPKITATPLAATATPEPQERTSSTTEKPTVPSYSASDVHTRGNYQYVVLAGRNAQIIRYTGQESSISISS